MTGVQTCALPISYYCVYHDMTNAVIGDCVSGIGESAFLNCYNLSSVTIGSSVTTLDIDSFGNCALTSIDLPNSVQYIKSWAFELCYHLSSVTIPSGVTSIGSNAFYNCTSLSSITVLATTPPTLGGNAFQNTNNATIYVPAASVNTYKEASGWSNYASRIQAITS